MKLTNFRSFAVLGFLRKKRKNLLPSFKALGKHMTHEGSQNSKKIENRSTLLHIQTKISQPNRNDDCLPCFLYKSTIVMANGGGKVQGGGGTGRGKDEGGAQWNHVQLF